jgi:hypothetical protein
MRPFAALAQVSLAVSEPPNQARATFISLLFVYCCED